MSGQQILYLLVEYTEYVHGLTVLAFMRGTFKIIIHDFVEYIFTTFQIVSRSCRGWSMAEVETTHYSSVLLFGCLDIINNK